MNFSFSQNAVGRGREPVADVSGFLFIAPQIPAGFEPHRSQLPTDPISVFTLLASPVTANSHKYIWEWEKKRLVLTQSVVLFPLTVWLHDPVADGREMQMAISRQRTKR